MPASVPGTVKVGVLNDMADFSEPEVGGSIPGDVAGWVERELEVLRKAGRLSAKVEVIHAYGLGFPSGTAEAVERAYRQLAEAGVALIVGPSNVPAEKRLHGRGERLPAAAARTPSRSPCRPSGARTSGE